MRLRWLGLVVVVGGAVGCGELLGLGDPVDASADAGFSEAAPNDGASDQGHTGDTGDTGDTGYSGDTGDIGDTGDGGIDGAGPDASPPCELGMPFGAPQLVAGTGVNTTTANEGTPRLSPNELTLYFWSDRTADGGTGYSHIYVATRAAKTAPFDPPMLLASVDSAGNDDSPTVTADGMTLVLASDRASPGGNDMLYTGTLGANGQFGTPQLLANVNSTFDETTPYLRPDGQILYFASDRGGTGGYDIYRAALQAGAFTAPQDESELDSTNSDFSPTVSPDDTVIYWGSDRPGALGGAADYDIYVAQRPNVLVGFGPATNLGAPLNSTAVDLPGWISPDGCTLYMESARAGTRDLYVAQRP